MNRVARNYPALLATAITLLLCAAAPQAAAAVDSVEAARLMIQSGLLGAAERPRIRFVAAFEALSGGAPAPDAHVSNATSAGQSRALQLAVASTFPPAQVRERWLRELTLRLDTEAFVAARAFFASIPGQTVASALRPGFRDGFRDGFPRRASVAATDQVAVLTDAAARDLVIDAHAYAMALWATRLIAADAAAGQARMANDSATAGELDFEAAFDRALEDSLEALDATPGAALATPPDTAHGDPLMQVPTPYREAFLEFAFSEAGDRFFTTSSAALEAALRQLARGQAGYFMEILYRHPPAVPLETP